MVEEKLIEEIVDENPDAVNYFLSGESQSTNYLVGVVLQRSGGTVGPSEAENALREYLENRVVDVTIPYTDKFSFSEKLSEIDGISDTAEAREKFRHPPLVSVTFEWDKGDSRLEPEWVKINGTEYRLVR